MRTAIAPPTSEAQARARLLRVVEVDLAWWLGNLGDLGWFGRHPQLATVGRTMIDVLEQQRDILKAGRR
jgi:hypothetical protein